MAFDRSDAGRRGRARGTRVEQEVAKALRRAGYTVASRRFEEGAGDHLAARRRTLTPRPELVRMLGPLILVETKGTTRPYHKFGPAERRALLEEASRAGAKPWLAHSPPGTTEITWIGPMRWPV